MAIIASDLKKYFTQGGGVSDGGAAGSAAVSLGGYRGTVEPTDNTDNNLFDDISGAEAAAGVTDYRCICLKNTHASLALQNAKVWIVTDEANASTAISIAVEVPTLNASTGNAQSVVNEATAPVVNVGNVSNWVASSAANSYVNGIAVNINGHSADMAAGNIIFVWVKRVISASAAAASGINFTIRLQGDTAA
ncbi:MAG: hypothetical protein FD174_2582 [Geobacteraceae bacterium]|nr:MAG: hypothetical protein FD174_2582 [Geobacteraceae bacterium]